jgi:hypothetical protein
MKNLKRFIVLKLGGVLYADLPLDIQQTLLNRAANKAIDFYAASMLKSGFTTNNQ